MLTDVHERRAAFGGSGDHLGRLATVGEPGQGAGRQVLGRREDLALRDLLRL